MMKILNTLLFTFAIVSFSLKSEASELALDSCYYNAFIASGDSTVFTYHSSDLKYDESVGGAFLDKVMAEDAIQQTLALTKKSFSQNKQFSKCEPRKLKDVKTAHIKCAEVLSTMLCKLDFSNAYFIVLKDYMDTVRVIFNRKD